MLRGRRAGSAPAPESLRLLHIPLLLCPGGDADGRGVRGGSDKQVKRESEAPGTDSQH